MYYGVAYYPEMRTEDQVERDLQLLAEAGMNVIRIGEFAWCEMEPEEGVYRFEWLEAVIGRAGRLGIQTVLCTPTAAPPAWLCERHPGMMYVDNYGRVRPFGGRRHYCYNNPIYRDYSYGIAKRMAEQFHSHPHVIGYQIDNELGQEGTGRCRCSVCRSLFHAWLERKYGTIEELNERWGTVFWGQRYNAFRQINLPVATIETNTSKPIDTYFDNPSLRLDFERFCSESMIAYQQVQAEALREHSGKQQVVTTNGTGCGTNSIDYFEGFRQLDRYGVDAYPNLRGAELYGASFEWALGRNVATQSGSSRFWVLELACGGGHALWGHEGRLQPYPGSIRQLAVHAFAGGAELVTHFQYIQFPYGAEQLNHSILDADGVPRRRYHEVKEAASDLKRLSGLLEETEVRCDTAVLFDYDSLWALKIKPVHKQFSWISHAQQWYEQLTRLGIGANVISAQADLSRYRLIVVPSLFLTDDGLQQKLKDYAEGGGIVVATFLTSVKNKDNVAFQETLPAGMTDLFGIHVVEWEPVFEHSVSLIELEQGSQRMVNSNRYWTESLESQGAELTAVYADTFREGEGVLSRSRFGKGVAYYVGTHLESESMRRLLTRIAAEAGVQQAPFSLPPGVEAIRREAAGYTAWFVFNASTDSAAVELDQPYQDVLQLSPVQDQLILPPKGYSVLKRIT
ncbi:beta-galactosidase [Paenibacillus sp. GD4]|uniref:beta-galactosidase n=1 Tax=Paenibacillus sp. GD4 TaxID=3068890 RepID=UPI0027968BC5|nr:beta-galactosidase [Paenibacillus sp. GD4]MDQ1914238.1 beta-galactosidase [Paenibacillus sp. GD4]